MLLKKMTPYLEKEEGGEMGADRSSTLSFLPEILAIAVTEEN